MFGLLMWILSLHEGSWVMNFGTVLLKADIIGITVTCTVTFI